MMESEQQMMTLKNEMKEFTKDLFGEFEKRLSVLESQMKSLDLQKSAQNGHVSNAINVEQRLVTAERQIVRLCLHQQSLKSRIAAGLVERVALVGLKEAITWPRRSLRIIWAVLLFFGLIATAYYICNTTIEYLRSPSATNVQLERLPKYNYPSLILCPGSWIDTPKALSKGLTKDALKYSIAFLDEYLIWDHTLNISRAKIEFEKFYTNRNYSSLLEYFKDVSTDIVGMGDSPGPLAANAVPGFYCSSCDESAPMEKVIVVDSVCYSFSLKPADGKHVKILDTTPVVYVQTKDRTNGVGQVTPNWRAYLMSETRILQPNIPSIAVEPFAFHTLKTTAQKFKILKSYESECLNPNEVHESDYSAERCRLKCLHKILKRKMGCDIFFYSAYDKPLRPREYCNYFENVPNLNMSFSDYMTNNASEDSDSKESAICIQNCPHRCDHTVYTSTLDSKFTVALDSYNNTVNAKQHNMSLVMVEVDHTAVSQGGILTLTEVSTFSFSTLVSNVGGTLGLFVGGTIMTFFQAILWFADHLLETRERKRNCQERCQNIVMSGNIRPA